MHNAIFAAAGSPPKFNLQDIGQLQLYCRFAAAALILIWVGYIIFQYAMPSRRGRGGLASIGGGKIAGFVVLIAVLIDLTLVDTFIAIVYNTVSWIGEKASALLQNAGGPSGGGGGGSVTPPQ